MGGYNWYMMKMVLKEFNVRTSWPEPTSHSMRFSGPDGRHATIYKSNNIKSEIVEWVVDILGLNMSEFERAYRAASS